MTILSSHALAKLLLAHPDGEVRVLEEVRGMNHTYTKAINVEVKDSDCFENGAIIYGTGIEITKNGDVFFGER